MASINVLYKVYAGGRWLPDVTNASDYAGIIGSPIQGLYANLDKGSIQYRVHTLNGDWLSWVTDRTDYAGIIGTNIDGLQMKVSGISGYNVRYRVYVGGAWLSWVKGLEDYAGLYGQSIEAIQVEIVSDNSGGTGSGNVNVTYKVYAGGRWLSDVTNASDYAGIIGSPIQGLYANLDKGSIQYRVHTLNGDWLSWVTDRTDYAGIIGTNIDGLQMKVSGISGNNVRYRVYVGGAWLSWVKGLEDYAGLYGQSIEAIQVEIVSDNSGGTGSGSVNVIYKVYAGGRWLPDVTNASDYAGIIGSPIQGVYANLDKGSIQYRVHTVSGDWLPWVTDRTDYAGSIGENIDGLQMQVIGLSGYTVSYRVYTGGRWLPWVKGMEDYAGVYGQAIEAIQAEIVTGNSGGSGGGEILPPVTGGRKVFIDPGHGGGDPGAVGNGMNEKDVVFEISKKVGNILTQKGVTVEYSRKSDVGVTLNGRAEMANSWGASLFVSIHTNGFDNPSANGTECFTYPTADSKNKQLSANIAKAISNKLGLTNRGHKEADFAVLRLTNMPAILVETAFISNASDADKLRNRKDDFAVVIAEEILKYLGDPSLDIKDLLKYAGNNGLFTGCNIEFEQLNLKTAIEVVQMIPLITVQGEISLTEKFVGPYNAIDLTVDAEITAKELLQKLIDSGIEFKTDELSLSLALGKLTMASNIGRWLKYTVELNINGVIVITFETSIKRNNITCYQRITVTIYPLNGGLRPSTIRVPVVATSIDKVEPDYKQYIYNIVYSVMLAGGIVGCAYIAPQILPTLIPIGIRYAY